MDSISINLTTVLGLLPVLIAVFFAVFIITLRHFTSGSKKLLFALFLVMAIVQFVFMMSDLGLGKLAQSFLFALVPIILLIPPLMFLYLASLCLEANLVKTSRIIYHFLPSIILLIANSVVFYLMYNVSDINLVFKLFDVFSFLILGGLVGVFTIQNILYITWGIRVYSKYKKHSKNYLSFETELNLKWMGIYLLGYFLFVSAVYLSSIFKIESSYFYNFALAAYIAFLGFRGTKQYDYYIGFKVNNAAINDINKNSVAEEIDEAEARKNEIKEKLLNVLETNKLYLKEDLTIFDLSKELNINYKYISQAINSSFKKNFNSFINEYRVMESLKLMKEPDNEKYTLEAISQMSGFKSRSSFYSFFKKQTGKTPSEFRENQ